MQQEAFAEILINEINDPDLEPDKKVTAIKQLSDLAFINSSHLIEYANNEGSSIVQEAALRSLGKLDGGQGVPILIEALSDERARIAIYALRTAIKSMPKDEAFSLLKSAPRSKVTVAKETLRLIGELQTEEAFQHLLEKTKENLHVDVRLALFKGLSSYTDRDKTWTFFQQMAEDPEPDVAKSVATISKDGLSAKAKGQLLKLLLHLLAHSDPVVRVATLKRCANDPVHDPENLLAPRLFELVHSPNKDEAENATEAIFKTYATSNIDLIRDTYRKLMSNGERLRLFHDQYWFINYGRKKMFKPVTHMILDVLKENRFSIKRRVKLMFEGLYWPEIKPYIFEIVPELHADALVEAEKAIEENLGRWKRERDNLLEAELEMANSEDERARRLALSFLIGSVEEDKGWKRAQVDRLDAYRQDPSPLVAERAWEVVVDEEANELDGEDEKI